MRHKSIHIVLLWHSFRSGNLGVGALSISNLYLIKDVCESAGLIPRFSIIGHGGPCDYRVEIDIDISYYSVGSLRDAVGMSILTTIRDADIVIDISEGDSFTDIYGPRRLFKQLFFKTIALVFKCPLVLAPQTIGPFKHWLSQTLAVFVMRHCHLVCVRDGKSRVAIEALASEVEVAEFIDVAFALPFERHKQNEVQNSRLRVGLNVSALLYNQCKSGENRFQLIAQYDLLIDDIIGILLSHGAEIHLIPHVIAPHFHEDDDVAVSREIKERYPSLHLPSTFTSPIEAKNYISRLDLLIGSRMHATIAGISSGVAILPLAYSRKFTGLFDSLDYRWVADLQLLDQFSVLELVEYALKHVDELQAAAQVSQFKAQGLLHSYKKQLTGLIMGLELGV